MPFIFHMNLNGDFLCEQVREVLEKNKMCHSELTTNRH